VSRQRAGVATTAIPAAAAWSASRLGDALVAIAERLFPQRRAPHLQDPPADIADSTALAGFVEDAACQLGLEVEAVDVGVATVRGLLAEGGPVLVAHPGSGPGPSEFLVLLACDRRGRGAEVLGADRRVYRLAAAEIDAWLDDEKRGPAGEAFAHFVSAVGLAARDQERTRRILGGAVGPSRPAVGWALHPAASRLAEGFQQSGARRVVGTALISYLVGFALMVGSWWLLGAAALQGHLERGWLWAWAMLLLTFVAFRSSGVWAAGRLAVQVGGMVREPIQEGILRQPADEVRVKGVGHLLGTVLEADALDAFARTGGPLLFADVFQFLFGAAVLALGAAPILHVALLVGWLVLAAGLVRGLYRRLLDWADARLALTDELVETMVGYRTLVVQQPAAQQQEGQDRELAVYGRKQAALDHEMARLSALLPRGWLVLGVAALIPGFATGSAQSTALAVSLGGVLMVYLAFRRVATETGPGLAAAFLGWRRTQPLFEAASQQREGAENVAVLPSEVDEASAGRRGLLVGRDVSFSYPGRLDPVLRGCNIEIRRRQRILIEGPSGSGKSTLGALLCGLRQPSGGLLLLGGFDHHSLRPERWRQRAAGVPQSHENHILSAPLLFNIAMARRWPPRQEDEQEIEAICRELGLSDLIARMPAGLQQMVGDSGWQLSQGERSRVCVARALLQQADLRVLDESFAALDPETMDRVLECVVRRSETLVVVSHA
jgi:ATP-binding cassette, subfamily B, bacterial